jgi:hypothetical protein
MLSFLWAVLLLGTSGSAQPVAPASQVIPAKVYGGYLVVVQGSIGPLEKRNLVIDTGAYPSIIDREVAKKLHLTARSSMLRVVDHNINSQEAFLPAVQVGPIRARGLRVGVQDLTSISRTYGVRVDALIGFDVLVGSSFRIDYREKKVIFGPIDSLPMSAPLHWTDNMPSVDLKVNDQPAHLLVDTASATVLLFGQRLPWTATYKGDARGFVNLGGSFQLREITAQSLELAGNDLGPGQVFISHAQNITTLHYDGFLATGVLPFRQIGFDVDHQRLGWEPANSKADTLRIRAAAKPREVGVPVATAAPISETSVAGECAINNIPGLSCGQPIVGKLHPAK